ncbi:MAG: NUDIX hydrolase [Nanoarchaeota archaeon]|nr:NUDIX hydrolase [Nanoarchaeota archaeon]
MMKDNPARWQELYESNDTRPFAGYGFGNIETIALSVHDPPPVFHDLRGCIEDFWGEFIVGKTGFTNDQKYGAQGFDYAYTGSTLTMNVFLTDYATVRFRNSRDEAYNSKLTDQQRQFFDNFLTLGVGAYLRIGEEVLLGRCAGDFKKDLLENVPQGHVEPQQDYGSIISAFARELSEETGLSLAALDDCHPTHLNVGKKFGDLTVIYQGNVIPPKKTAIHSSEHAELWWMKEETLRWMVKEQPMLFNPVTVALVEALA